MGVNVTQLLNEEIKVIVEGGDNIATKTELNAGLDLKANKVVGGIFDGMDLKPAAEKLNNDKQDKIVDSGWLQLTVPSNWKDGEAFIRRIQGVAHLRMLLQFPDNDNDWSGSTYNALGSILPVGYRPLEPFSITLSTSSNSTISTGINIAGASVSVISSAVEIFANRSEQKNRWIGVSVSYMVN